MNSEAPVFVEIGEWTAVQRWHIVKVHKKKKIITACNRTVLAQTAVSATMPDGDLRCPICFVQD